MTIAEMIKNHWSRVRLYGDYGYFMHKEWVFDIHQLAYNHIKNKNGEWYRILVRTKKGLFGATKWVILKDVDTQEECCKIINDFVKDYHESFMTAQINEIHNAKELKANLKKITEHCGFDIGGIM